ncbi:cation transporter (plasmid) [Halorussus vallis]|nr:heavy metal-associated domain-containing protein [Halorussus vallis]USZ78491.1 cation transporter [Halorussus vallis]
MERKTIAVTGMSCNGCEQNVENALKTIEGVTRVEADLAQM